MKSESLVCRFGEAARRVEYLSITTDSLDERFDVLKPLEEFGIIFSEGKQRLSMFSFCIPEVIHSTVFESLIAPHTEWFISGSVTTATRTFERGKLVGFVAFNFLPLETGVLGFGIFPKFGNIATNGLDPSLPTLPVLDQSGICVPVFRQPGCIGIAEVSRSNGFVEVSAVGTLFEALNEPLIGVAFGIVELSPQGGVWVFSVGVLGKPPLETRDTEICDERDCALSCLAVNADSIAVFPVRHVANGQIAQFPSSESCLKLNSDKRGISRVPGGVDHGFHVALQVENFGRVGCWVVVTRGFRGNPCDVFRETAVVSLDSEFISDTTREYAERDTVVAVRLLIIVVIVNPADDVLGDLLIFECLAETADLLGHTRAVTQELQVAVVAARLAEEEQSIAEVDKYLPVGIAAPALAGARIRSRRRSTSLRGSDIYMRL